MYTLEVAYEAVQGVVCMKCHSYSICIWIYGENNYVKIPETGIPTINKNVCAKTVVWPLIRAEVNMPA